MAAMNSRPRRRPGRRAGVTGEAGPGSVVRRCSARASAASFSCWIPAPSYQLVDASGATTPARVNATSLIYLPPSRRAAFSSLMSQSSATARSASARACVADTAARVCPTSEAGEPSRRSDARIMETMAYLDDLVTRARADPAVVGLVLTGSHARGLATAHSDIDVCVVVGERGGARWPGRRTAEVDEFVCTADELADTSDVWQRYAFRGCRVLLDRPDGLVARLVHRQATPTPAEALGWARDGLDGYVNFLYRAAKSRRDGQPVAAALDTAESVPWLLTTVFALHGRLRPYNKYLRWELTTYPMAEPWTAGTLPERLLRDPAGLFPDVERLARARGLGDVLDAWGDDLHLLRRPGTPP